MPSAIADLRWSGVGEPGWLRIAGSFQSAVMRRGFATSALASTLNASGVP